MTLLRDAHFVDGLLEATRSEAHPFCFACSGSNPMGLALRYALRPDGRVSSTFTGNGALEGYPTRLHGGLVATLLDAAMTNCLFAHGIRAATVELHVRYHAAVLSTTPLTVLAWRESTRHGLHLLRAEICQEDALRATARGKFLRIRNPS